MNAPIDNLLRDMDQLSRPFSSNPKGLTSHRMSGHYNKIKGRSNMPSLKATKKNRAMTAHHKPYNPMQVQSETGESTRFGQAYGNTLPSAYYQQQLAKPQTAQGQRREHDMSGDLGY